MTKRKLLAFGLSAALLGGAASLIKHDVSAPPSMPSMEKPAAAQPVTATKRLPTLAVTSTTSMDDLITRLDAATIDDERRQLSRELHEALVDALQRDPEGALAQLKPWLMEADSMQRATQVALGAMVAVGSPTIQSAIVGLIEARSEDRDFVRTALPTMSFLAEPTRETENAVRGWTAPGHDERMQSMAHLSLGTMASHLATGGDATRSAAIVDEYATRIASSTEPSERARWLQVLGNVRTPEAARVVTNHLNAEDPKVRSRAVEALRLAPTPGVDAMLTNALNDSDPDVRASAAWSLGYRAPDAGTMRTMTAKLSEEQDVAVVTKLLDVLWIRRDTDRVAIVSAVQRVAREHPSEKVRAHAQQLLDTAS